MSAIDFYQVRQLITMDAVLDVIQWKPFRSSGAGERGPCPIHGSTGPNSRSFSVDRRGNRFQCFKCQAKGNQLDLYVQVTKLGIYEASIELCRRLGIEVPRLERSNQRRGTRNSGPRNGQQISQ